MGTQRPRADSTELDAFLARADAPARAHLRKLMELLRAEAPGATVQVADGLVVTLPGEGPVRVGVTADHLALCPSLVAPPPAPIEPDGLQLPYAAPLPIEALRRFLRIPPASPEGAAPKRAAEAYPQVEVASRAELRAWLASAHRSSRGAWVVTFKKHVADRHVDAAAVAEEALCVGWIDSLPRALDEDRTMLLVTPRKPRSAWSAVNKERVERLIAAGQMKPAGLAVVEAARQSGTWAALDAVEALLLPADLLAAFDAAPPRARTHFEAFPRSAKRGILEWIQNAKKPDTRAKRIAETVSLAVDNVRALQWTGGAGSRSG